MKMAGLIEALLSLQGWQTVLAHLPAMKMAGLIEAELGDSSNRTSRQAFRP